MSKKDYFSHLIDGWHISASNPEQLIKMVAPNGRTLAISTDGTNQIAVSPELKKPLGNESLLAINVDTGTVAILMKAGKKAKLIKAKIESIS
jgi:hypothetical protein